MMSRELDAKALDECIAKVLELRRYLDTDVWCTARQKQCFEGPLSENWNAIHAAMERLEKEPGPWVEFRRSDSSWSVTFTQHAFQVANEPYTDQPEHIAAAKCIQAVVESEHD